jgi:hypothetical protein
MSSAFSVLSGYGISPMRNLVENLESSNVRGETILHERSTRAVQTGEWITTVLVVAPFLPSPQWSNNSASIDFYMHVPFAYEELPGVISAPLHGGKSGKEAVGESTVPSIFLPRPVCYEINH